MSVFAKVRIEVEVDCGQGWSDKITAAELSKSAKRVVIDRLRRLHESTKGEIRTVGQPKVTAFWTEIDE